MAMFDALRFKIGADLSDFESGMRKVDDIAGKSAQSLGNAFKAVGAIGATVFGTAGLITKGVVETASQMETLEARLSSLLGSAEAGKQRLNELIQIGASSPFDVTQLAEATATLEAFTGRSDELLGPVQDLAAFMNTDLNEAAQSLGRAFAGGAGAADVLRDRGILRMVELREGVKATDMSVEELQEALIGLMTDETGQIAGGADRLADTWAGMVSNMTDQWVQFQAKIGASGLFEGLQNAGRELLTVWEENTELVDRLAEEIGVGILAGIATLVDGAGALYDGWTQFQIAIKSTEGIIQGLSSLLWGFLADFRSGVSDVLADMAEMAESVGLEGLASDLRDAQDAMGGFADVAAAKSEENAAKMRETREEVDALKASLGEGAEFAERLNAALLDQREGGGSGTDFGLTTGAEKEKPKSGDDEELEKAIEEALRTQQDMNDALYDEQKKHEADMLALEEKAANQRLALEKQAAARRLAQQEKEMRQRQEIAENGMSLINGLVREANELRLNDELSASQKILALTLSTFSEMLKMLAARLAVEAMAALASQNYLEAGLKASGAVVAAAGAAALGSEADKVGSGESSTFSEATDSASSSLGIGSGSDDNGDQQVALDLLARAADSLENAADSLERAASSLQGASTGGGRGGRFSVEDDARSNGPLRRFVRNAMSRTGRAGFRGA